MNKALSFAFGISLTLLVLSFITSFLIHLILSPVKFTPKSMIKEILKAMDLKKTDVLTDLGVGDGRIVIAAYKNFKAKSMSTEFSPILFLLTKIKRFLLGIRKKHVQLSNSSFIKQDFSLITKVYCFLDSKTLTKTKDLLFNKLETNTLIFCYKNHFPDLATKEIIRLSNGESLFVYKV